MAHKEKGIRVDSLDSWEALIERYFADDASQCIAVKSAIAYWRPLDFEAVERAEAQRAVQKLLASKGTAEDAAESTQLLRRTFQNYGIRFIVKLAGQYGLPVKFHTGGYAGYADAARPLRRMRENLPDLAPLIADFPKTNFILFHHAYPYGEAAVLLAKHCANCFIDQSWTWIVNPATASRYLFEFLLGAPSNKLFFFGGDQVLWRRLPTFFGPIDMEIKVGDGGRPVKAEIGLPSRQAPNQVVIHPLPVEGGEAPIINGQRHDAARGPLVISPVPKHLSIVWD